MQKERAGLVFKPPDLRDAPSSIFQAPGEPKHVILVQHEPIYLPEYLCWIRIIQRKTASRLNKVPALYSSAGPTPTCTDQSGFSSPRIEYLHQLLHTL